MADFTSIKFECNTNTNGSPTWTDVAGGSNKEVRFSDISSAGLATASASWPAMTRPAATASVEYAYAFTADTTGLGIINAGSNVPTAWASLVGSVYLFARWNWDNTATFASAPIFTAYPTTGHGAVSRGDGSLLGGHASDTGGTARSYLKGNLYGTGATVQVPAAVPSNAPVVTDGATGALTPGSGAWLTNYQGLQGDSDWIAYGSTPTALTAQVIYIMFHLFTGPNMTAPAVHVPVMSLKYTYS